MKQLTLAAVGFERYAQAVLERAGQTITAI
jgi:hypothetical protein